MLDIVSWVSQRIGILRLVKCIFVNTSGVLRCYFAFALSILEYCSPMWGSAAEYHLQLLERQVYSVARLCPDQSFLSLCHRCVAGLSRRLIRTLITVCSVSFHMLLLEFDIPELRLRLINWNLKYRGVERLNLHGVSWRPRFECGMTYPTLCLIPERWMGLKVQSTVGCFSEFCFLQFSVAQVLVGLWKQIIYLFFPLGPVLLVLIK